MMLGRASNGSVDVGERLDFYNDPWNSSRLDDSTTTTLNSVNSMLEDLMRHQQPKCEFVLFVVECVCVFLISVLIKSLIF